MIEVARALDPAHRAVFMGYEDDFVHLIRKAGFEYHPCSPSWSAQERQRAIDFDQGKAIRSPFTRELVAARVAVERRMIRQHRAAAVVIGSNVRVMPAAVSHGSLSVTITERIDVSQPNAFAEGRTVAAPRSELNVESPPARMFKFEAGVSLDELVQAVNRVGAAPGDLVAILEALKQAGALRAELIVI